MGIPTYGAAPLAKFFIFLRTLQLIAFICIVGVTANFVSEIVNTGATPAREIVGTLTVTCLAMLYTLISVPFFFAPANMGLLMMCGLDFLLLIAFVVVAVTLGRPISYLNCFAVGNTSQAVNAANAFAFTESVGNNIGKQGNLVGWTGATRANCFETKGVWGMSIALCILFTCTVLVLPALFAKAKRAAKLGAKGYV